MLKDGAYSILTAANMCCHSGYEGSGTDNCVDV